MIEVCDNFSSNFPEYMMGYLMSLSVSGAAVSPRRILLATTNPNLRETRKQLIQSFGFEVIAPTTKQEAIGLIQTESFDLLIMGHTLPVSECLELASAYRERQPRGRIIEVITSSIGEPKNNPDATVGGLDGPAALQAAIQSQLQHAV